MAIHNGAIFYEGEAALAPKEWLSLPGVVGLMHPHDKARLDAALNKAARLDARKAPLPQNLVEAQVALNKPAFHPTQLPGLIDHMDASDPSTLEGRGLPDFPGPIAKPIVVGNAELDQGAPNHFDPNKRGFSPR